MCYERYPIDEVEAVYLLDAETGKTTNLLFGSYTIETTQQLYTNTRFSINVLLRRKQVVDTPTMIMKIQDGLSAIILHCTMAKNSLPCNSMVMMQSASRRVENSLT